MSVSFSDELLIIIPGPFLYPVFFCISLTVVAQKDPSFLRCWHFSCPYSFILLTNRMRRSMMIQTSTASGYSRVRLASCCSFRLNLLVRHPPQLHSGAPLSLYTHQPTTLGMAWAAVVLEKGGKKHQHLSMSHHHPFPSPPPALSPL